MTTSYAFINSDEKTRIRNRGFLKKTDSCIYAFAAFAAFAVVF